MSVTDYFTELSRGAATQTNMMRFASGVFHFDRTDTVLDTNGSSLALLDALRANNKDTFDPNGYRIVADTKELQAEFSKEGYTAIRRAPRDGSDYVLMLDISNNAQRKALTIVGTYRKLAKKGLLILWPVRPTNGRYISLGSVIDVLYKGNAGRKIRYGIVDFDDTVPNASEDGRYFYVVSTSEFADTNQSTLDADAMEDPLKVDKTMAAKAADESEAIGGNTDAETEQAPEPAKESVAAPEETSEPAEDESDCELDFDFDELDSPEPAKPIKPAKRTGPTRKPAKPKVSNNDLVAQACAAVSDKGDGFYAVEVVGDEVIDTKLDDDDFDLF